MGNTGVGLMSKCGSLNENNPISPSGLEQLRGCGCFVGDVPLVLDFEVQEAQARTSGLVIPAAHGSKCRTLSYLSGTMYVCMSPCFLP